MSEEELVGAYAAGSVSRRVFIRGLVAMGVSAGAAIAYADALSAQAPKGAARPDVYDVYPPQQPTATTTVGIGPGDVGATGLGKGGAAPSVEARPKFTG